MRAPDRRLKAVRAGSAAAIEESQHSCGLMPLPAQSGQSAAGIAAGRSVAIPKWKGVKIAYCAAARIGMCARRKRRTRSIVRSFNSAGSFHGKTVISAFGASEATSIEVCSGCAGTSSGSTSIGVRQFPIKSRDTLYKKSG